MVSFTPLPLYPQGKSPWYPLDRRLAKRKKGVTKELVQRCRWRGGWEADYFLF